MPHLLALSISLNQHEVPGTIGIFLICIVAFLSSLRPSSFDTTLNTVLILYLVTGVINSLVTMVTWAWVGRMPPLLQPGRQKMLKNQLAQLSGVASLAATAARYASALLVSWRVYVPIAAMQNSEETFWVGFQFFRLMVELGIMSVGAFFCLSLLLAAWADEATHSSVGRNFAGQSFRDHMAAPVDGVPVR